jgi:hypothetical protein
MLAKPNINRKTDAQRRFLEAYAKKLNIALAARQVGIHRATVYRWMTDPAFVIALRGATAEFSRRIRARVAQQ